MTLVSVGADAEESTPPPAKPRPALIAPLAEKTLMLGLAQAGSGLVAVGARGHILLSTDGKAWKQVQAPANSMLNRVRFRDEKTGWAVGHDATILGTQDGGQTWSLQHFSGEGRPLNDVLFLGEQRLIGIGGYGSYYISADDGKTWEARSSPITELGQHLNAATRLADGSLLIAGERGLLLRSADNGETWDLLDSPYSGSFFGVLPLGEKGALAFGLRGNIYVSNNVSTAPKLDPATYDAFTRETVTDADQLAKLGWRRIEAPTTESMFGGIRDGDTFLLVGVNGVMLRVDTAQNQAQMASARGGESLNDVIKFGNGWVVVGRRGIQSIQE